MFQEFLKRQSHVFYLQFWPQRIKATELHSAQFYDDEPIVALEIKDEIKTIKEIGVAARAQDGLTGIVIVNPFYNNGYAFSDVDCAVALINHAIFAVSEGLQGKIFAPLIIFHPMESSKEGLCTDDVDIKKVLSDGCGARTVIIMHPDEYLDL